MNDEQIGKLSELADHMGTTLSALDAQISGILATADEMSAALSAITEETAKQDKCWPELTDLLADGNRAVAAYTKLRCG